MHPAHFAATTPHRPAIVMAASGETVSYGELEARSNQAAQMFRALGLRRGDHIAFMLENRAGFFAIAWAAQRSGLYFTAISTRLTAGEVDYIVRDSTAKVFISSTALA
ncbi:MAG TPA: AMP-binding protein, partial [Candidatus Sulfotelmatobacter sp.]|nr:AMP-binding protein [Candidatus Sulfotelmatobacter sp.]